LEDIYSLIDSFIVCKNAKATFYKELAELSKLYTLVTGNELPVEDLSASAERINTLARLINTREGLSRKDDTLPWKVLNVPIPDDGPAKGAIVTQEELDLMLDDYYDARGWNLEGVPKAETLNRLSMEEFVGLTELKEA
jgi:aldehyde:ferredoxin oxidoreductase